MTTDCREVRPLLEAFVSEQLLVETTQGIVAHLDKCQACRAEVEGLRRLRAATRQAFDASPELAARPEFLRAMGDRLRTEAARGRPVPAARRRWVAVAASLLLVAGAGLGVRYWSVSSLTSLLHAAVGDHRFCALTFKLAEQPIPIAEAATRFGGVHAALAAVEPEATELSGGPLRIVDRHSCLFEGRRFVHLVLQYRDLPVSVLVAADQPWLRQNPRGDRSAAGGATSLWPATDGFRVASFSGPRHIVFLVSSLKSDDLQEVSRAMTGPVSRALEGA